MSLDVNKIITESLQTITKDQEVITEDISTDLKNAGEDIKTGSKKIFHKVFGSKTDVMKDELEGQLHKGLNKAEEVGDNVKEGISKAGKKVAEFADEAKEKIVSAGNIVADQVKEHPGVAAATVAAIAAGLGGLALRKRMKKVKEGQNK